MAPSNHQKKPNSTWKQENPGYGIYNPDKHITISTRLPGLQNILLKVELTTIYYTLQIITNQFPNELAYIFTDSLTSLYLLLIQLKHPTHHNDHPDKTILQSMIMMLSKRTQTTIIIKVKAHTNIDGYDYDAKQENSNNHHYKSKSTY